MAIPLRRRRAWAMGVALLALHGPALRAWAQGLVPPRPIPKPAVPPRPIPKPATQLQLEIEAPKPNELIGTPDAKLLVSGRALSASTQGGRFDVMVVIDTSGSTSAPSGADIDADGIVGRSLIPGIGPILGLPGNDRGDSVLAAEVAATRAILDQLDPRSTRVGIVSFAGDSRKETPDARLDAPLTFDYAQIETALDALLAVGTRGRTNIFAGTELAALQLTGGRNERGHPRREARKVILLMTDGQATLPDGSSRRRSAQFAVDAAKQAAQLGVRIDTFAVGPAARGKAWVTSEMAAASGGVFTPVVQPGDLVAAFQDVRLADVTAIQIGNLTTRKPAEYVQLDSDGWFAGIVPMVPGRNRIEIRAYASNGRRIIRVIDARLVAGAAAQVLTSRLMERRTRMLETRLDQTRSQTLELEAERTERVRDALADEMREQRKRSERKLEIEGEAVPAAPDEAQEQ